MSKKSNERGTMIKFKTVKIKKSYEAQHKIKGAQKEQKK